MTKYNTLDYQVFGDKDVLDILCISGGPGGGSHVIQSVFFDPISSETNESSEFKRVAGTRDGANSIASGQAAWRSVAHVSDNLQRSKHQSPPIIRTIKASAPAGIWPCSLTRSQT